MKKLIAMLFLVVMAAYAAESGTPYDLSMNWKDGQKVATLHDYTNANGKTGLTYTVTKNNHNSQTTHTHFISQLYFTTKDAATLNLQEGEVVAVQFMGAEISAHGASLANFDVKDYGIYLYDPTTGDHLSDYMSIGSNNNYFEIGENQNFGVYYVNKQGQYITSTENYVANYDADDHEITIYSETVDGVTTEYPEGKVVTTSKRYMCMLEEEQFVHPHWEFMLQTTLDNPYFAVNPNDFGTDVHIDNPVVNNPNGQPLPGTLATLLIGGLCAGSLRKRKKK